MKDITFNDFYQLYQNSPLSVLDVREVEEFEALHLEGAVISLSVNWLILINNWTKTSFIT